MKVIKFKLFKKAIKDAKRRGLSELTLINEEGEVIKVREISVSNITGMQIHIKK